MRKWSAIFPDEKVKGQGHRTLKPQKTGVMFTCGRQIKRRPIRRRLQAKPTPLLGLIYCQRLNMRRSAIGQTAAYHVGSLADVKQESHAIARKLRDATIILMRQSEST